MGDFLGVGWSTTRHIDAGGGADGKGAIALSKFDDNIRESIITIVKTALGERQMRPDFGCDTQTLVFGGNDATTAGRVAFFTELALKRWEPRIEVLRVEARPDVDARDRIIVEIEYQVIATNTIFNLVYPFYLTEGVGG